MKLEETTSTVVDGVEVFPVPGFEGRYGISKCGRLLGFPFSSTRLTKNRGEVPLRIPQKWIRITAHESSGGYPKARIRTEKNVTVYVYIHRLMAATFLGSPQGLEVDHIDGDRTNNSLANLRLTDRSGNSRNCPVSKNNRSGFKGVHESRGRFYARIYANGITHCLGGFSDPKIAAIAYDQAASVYHGDFAQLNFPRSNP